MPDLGKGASSHAGARTLSTVEQESGCEEVASDLRRSDQYAVSLAQRGIYSEAIDPNRGSHNAYGVRRYAARVNMSKLCVTHSDILWRSSESSPWRLSKAIVGVNLRSWICRDSDGCAWSRS